MTRHEESQEMRQYLLGNLSEGARQRIEERLLTEEGFHEEMLLSEEELIDDYVCRELSEAERLKFEEHFLCTPARRRQLRFALALNLYASNAPTKPEDVPEAEPESVSEAEPEEVPDRPRVFKPPPPVLSWAERFRAFRVIRPLALASAALVLAVVAGLWLWRSPQPQPFASITLTMAADSRGNASAQAGKVTLPLDADALNVSLKLPDDAKAKAGYRVEMWSDSGEVTSLKVAGRDAGSVSVVIPSAQLARGRYALKLYAAGDDGTEQRVAGSYFLNVE